MRLARKEEALATFINGKREISNGKWKMDRQRRDLRGIVLGRREIAHLVVTM